MVGDVDVGDDFAQGHVKGAVAGGLFFGHVILRPFGAVAGVGQGLGDGGIPLPIPPR